MHPNEIAAKHACVAAYLDSHKLDGVLLSRRCNFSWYTCGAHNYVGVACDVGNSTLLVTREGARVFTNNIESPRLRDEELAGLGIEVVDWPWHDAAAGSDAFRNATEGFRLACDAPVAGVEAVQLGQDWDRLRWRLTAAEKDRYRSLSTDAVAALESAARSAKPGVSETTLAGRVAAECRARGCVCWTLLVAADERVERFRHPLPTDKKAERYFMLVVGAERDGLIASHTRLASFGPVDDELRRKQDAVARVDAALIATTRPGATLGEVLAAGQQAYAETGFAEEWRLHHQGGSCGYLPRDVKASPGETVAVVADQAFAWNPTITGAKSEDTILCQEGDVEVLGMSDEWPVIEAAWNGQVLHRADILTL